MNISKTVLASVLLTASLAFACGGSDGTTTDSSGTEGRRTSRGTNDDSSGDDRGSRSTDDDSSSNDDPSSDQPTQDCRGSSVCINGSCRCESGPQKGKSCCYAPEEEDDPPCAQANECDNVCNSCK